MNRSAAATIVLAAACGLATAVAVGVAGCSGPQPPPTKVAFQEETFVIARLGALNAPGSFADCVAKKVADGLQIEDALAPCEGVVDPDFGRGGLLPEDLAGVDASGVRAVWCEDLETDPNGGSGRVPVSESIRRDTRNARAKDFERARKTFEEAEKLHARAWAALARANSQEARAAAIDARNASRPAAVGAWSDADYRAWRLREEQIPRFQTDLAVEKIDETPIRACIDVTVTLEECNVEGWRPSECRRLAGRLVNCLDPGLLVRGAEPGACRIPAVEESAPTPVAVVACGTKPGDDRCRVLTAIGERTRYWSRPVRVGDGSIPCEDAGSLGRSVPCVTTYTAVRFSRAELTHAVNEAARSRDVRIYLVPVHRAKR